MKTIGELLEGTLNLTSQGLLELAFTPVCEALNQTAKKLYPEEIAAEPAFQRFIKDNWGLIKFMGIPHSDSIPTNLPFGVRRAVASLNMPHLDQEIVIYMVRQILHTRRFPPEIGFHKSIQVNIEDGKLMFPNSLIFALIGCVVFNPINKDEKISELYWINIRGFQMFISELWGRDDLVKRIMNLYTGKR